MADSQNKEITNTPKADPALSALAVLASFVDKDYQSTDLLLDTTDERELIMGLLNISQHMATMLGLATGGDSGDVVRHVRQTVLSLIADGTWESGSPVLS